MKVRVYYLIDSGIFKELRDHKLCDWLSVETPEDQQTCLYAYTTSKKLAKQFEETRNKDCFYKKTLEMTEEQFKEFENAFFIHAKISIASLKYSAEDDEIDVAITNGEHWYVKDSGCESTYALLEALPSIPTAKIFKKDILSVLVSLGFASEVTQELESDEIKYLGNTDPVAYYTANYAWKNELGLFFYLYGKLVDKESVIEVAYGKE